MKSKNVITKEQLLDYPNRILVAGSRYYSDYAFFSEAIKDLVAATRHEGPVAFITGVAATGADAMIVKWCEENNYPYAEFPADWDNLKVPNVSVKVNTRGKEYNSLAGFNRNNEMAEHLTEAVFFWDKKSSGTKDMINRVKEKKLQFLIVIINSSKNQTL